MIYDARGVPYLSSAGRVPVRWDQYGKPEFAVKRRLLWHTWTKYDTGTRESAAPSDGGSLDDGGTGISIGVTGGWSTTDLRNAVIYADPEPIVDALGRRYQGAMNLLHSYEVVSAGGLGAIASNYTILGGIVLWTGNADPTAATELVASGLEYYSTANQRYNRRLSVFGGVASLVGAGGGSSNADRLQTVFQRAGLGASSRLVALGGAQVTNAAHTTIAANGSTAVSFCALGTSVVYQGFFILRTSTSDATSRSTSWDIYASPAVAGLLD